LILQTLYNVVVCTVLEFKTLFVISADCVEIYLES